MVTWTCMGITGGPDLDLHVDDRGPRPGPPDLRTPGNSDVDLYWETLGDMDLDLHTPRDSDLDLGTAGDPHLDFVQIPWSPELHVPWGLEAGPYG